MSFLKARLGWGILDVFWVFALRIMLVFLIGKAILPLLPGISPRLVEILDRFILLGLTIYFVLQKDNLTSLGFRFNNLGRQIIYGVMGGFFLFLLAEGTQRALVTFLAADIGTNPLVKAAAGARNPVDLVWPILIGGVLVPITEETYYRGMAFQAFSGRWGIMIGLVVSSIFFSLAHLSGIWFVQIATVGAGLALIYYLTGSLIPGIIAHGMVNSARLLLVYWQV